MLQQYGEPIGRMVSPRLAVHALGTATTPEKEALLEDSLCILERAAGSVRWFKRKDGGTTYESSGHPVFWKAS